MPMEGQAQRALTPLTRRDRRVIAVILCAAVIGASAAVVLGHAFSAPRTNAGCVTAAVASTTGGITSRNCGRAAQRFCAAQGRIDASVTAQCRRLGDALPAPQTRPGS